MTYKPRFSVIPKQEIDGTGCLILVALRKGQFKNYGAPLYKRGDVVLFVNGEDAPRILTPKVPVPT